MDVIDQWLDDAEPHGDGPPAGMSEEQWQLRKALGVA